MAVIETDRLVAAFVELADTLVDDFDLIEFLHRLTTHTSKLVADHEAGLLLADHLGHLQLMAASDERAEMVELFQVQESEGPCQDCFRQGEPVINADLATASARWPTFAPRAVAAGYRSVHAFPMRLRDNVIGALNLFGTEAGRMRPEDARVIQALADVATISLLQERAIRHGTVLTEQLQSALNTRIVIEQAKGILSEIHACTPTEAFGLLRDFCRQHNLKLSEVAQRVATDASSVPELTSLQQRGQTD